MRPTTLLRTFGICCGLLLISGCRQKAVFPSEKILIASIDVILEPDIAVPVPDPVMIEQQEWIDEQMVQAVQMEKEAAQIRQEIIQRRFDDLTDKAAREKWVEQPPSKRSVDSYEEWRYMQMNASTLGIKKVLPDSYNIASRPEPAPKPPTWVL